MNDREKYAEQLSLAIELNQAVKSHLAKSVHVSNAQVTKYLQGKATVEHSVKLGFNKRLKSIWLKFSAAREDFGIPSFFHDPKLRTDYFAATVSAEKEERERQELEVEFRQIIIRKSENWTRYDHEFIDSYFQNYLEEVGAENTRLLVLADYLGIDISPYIEAYNDASGG